MARENYNPDALYIGDFKGLATAGGSFGADPSYLQTLTNAFVTKDGKLKQRSGSNFLYGLSTTALPEFFQFTFAGERFIIHRTGVNLSIYRVALDTQRQPYNVQVLSLKTGVLRDASSNEPATYAVKNDGNYCHVLIATASTTLIDVVLTYRDSIVSSTTATTSVSTIGQYFSANNISQSNSKVFTTTDVSPTTTIANVGNQLTLTWASRPVEFVVGYKFRLFSCFWLRAIDANFYQGAQFYNTGLRRNTVPLDVNVEVPESLVTNAIFNEPIQDLNYETYRLFEQTTTNAARLNKVTNRQPLTTNDWDFSDGSYRAVSTLLSNRTPNYIAFGGLQSNNVSSRLGIARLRTILLSSFEYASISDITCVADVYTTLAPTYHTFDGTVITTGEPKYVSFSGNISNPPGVNLEAVVELLYFWNGSNVSNGAITGADGLDISNSRDIHYIRDGAYLPIYGYNIVARMKSFSFPNIVRFVGNRMVLAGSSNQILVSSSNWNYRGISFNNCQVSSLNFDDTSPYLLQVEQAGGNVRAIESVNGVMLVVSDSATYRVSGKERNSPPNASTAIISRLTNQITNASTLVVAENSVYLANNKGLYKINYVREQDEGVLEDISLPVANLFREQPTALVYSRAFDCLLLRFPNQRKLLAYNLLTRTFSQVGVSVPFDLLLFPTLDGYMFTNGTAQVVASWNPQNTADLVGLQFLSLFTVGANEVNITNAPVSAGNLNISPYLAQRYSGAFVALPAYNEQIRSVGNAFFLTEQSSGNTAKAIFSSAVTKAIYTDKFNRGLRLREANVLLAGTGTAAVVVADAGLENANQRLPMYNVSVDSFGRATVTGEQNKASNNLSFPTGDTVNVRLGSFGLSEAYAFAIQLSPSLECVGFALNTSARALGRANT